MTGDTDARAVAALVVPHPELDRVMDHLRGALPHEGVGLLGVERFERGGIVIARVRQFYPGANIRASPTRYEMDPHELIAALRDIDRQGWAPGAIVHSHPHGPATPSATDLAEFQYPESLMVIASFAEEPPNLNAWRLEAGQGTWIPREVPIFNRIDEKTGLPIAETGTLRE